MAATDFVSFANDKGQKCGDGRWRYTNDGRVELDGSFPDRSWPPEINQWRDLINEKAAKKRREYFGLKSACTGTDLRTMLKTVKPDVVFDCTLPESHVSVTLEALCQGCHVLGEKPLADSMANARRMVAAAKKARKVYAVIQNRRYTPQIKAFRDLIASRKMGDLTTLNCDFYIGAHFGGFRDKMKHVLLLDMAIHTFDAIRFISGANPVSVYCKEWNPKGSWYRHGASAVAVFEMTKGVIVTYRGSWCSEGLNTTWESDWRAVGSKGNATWDGADKLNAQVVRSRGGFFSNTGDIPVRFRKSGYTGHEAIIREFLSCVRSGKRPQTVCTDNVKSLAMVFGAIESAEKGKKVKVKA